MAEIELYPEPTWQSDIPKCFNNADKNFCGDRAAEETALSLLGRLKEENISWPLAKNAFRSWLDTRGNFDYFSQQMEKIQTYFADKLPTK